MYTITDDHLKHLEELIDTFYREWDDHIADRDEFENGSREWNHHNALANFPLGKAHGFTEVLDYIHNNVVKP